MVLARALQEVASAPPEGTVAARDRSATTTGTPAPVSSHVERITQERADEVATALDTTAEEGRIAQAVTDEPAPPGGDEPAAPTS